MGKCLKLLFNRMNVGFVPVFSISSLMLLNYLAEIDVAQKQIMVRSGVLINRL